MPIVDVISLQDTAQQKYLNYALSVITSRALPDVRDGLKPVHRRILYSMYNNLHLMPEGRYRKSALVVGDCFVEGTLVNTPTGLRRIESLEIDDEVYTQIGIRKVTQCYVMPPQPLLEIEFSDGRKLICTKGQKFKLLNPELGYEWKTADQMQIGDVAICRSVAMANQNEAPQPNFDSDMAYLLGFFFADGWIDRDPKRGFHRLAFACSDEPIIQRIQSILLDKFGYEASILLRRKLYWLRINRNEINQWFIQTFDLQDKYADNIGIPKFVLEGNEEVAMAFLSGFIDGDGSVHKVRSNIVLNSICESFIRDVQTLLHRFGIHSRFIIQARNQKYNHKHRTEWGVEIDGFSVHKLGQKLHLSSPKKQSRLERVLSKEPLTPEQALKIPFAGKTVINEFSEKHLGGGWYMGKDGAKIRSGLKYPNGRKIRYYNNLAENFDLHFPQLNTMGILKKLDLLDSSLVNTFIKWIEEGISFTTVKSIKEVEPQITFDIQVEEEHEFIANGVVVHNCIGKLHPHGDVAVYDAMVRMAQDFAMRMMLVDGHGNFGSIDGDSPAAMRYTECKLRPLAVYLIEEIKKQTVQFRPNYDGTLFEPVVLPAQYPNLLVNGSSGIAVGMATNIPPHNLTESIDAAILLSKTPNATTEKLFEVFHGADFPTGGRILNKREDLIEIYEKGEGAIELRGEYKTEKLDGGKNAIILTSVPYGLTKSDLVEKIAEIVRTGKLPQIVDVWDESTDEVRVVLEMKRGASEEAAMAYLFKHTTLQTRFHINMTCLVPTDNPEIARPERVNLKKALRYFLDFRLEVLIRRLKHELEQLEKRIHILNGFVIIFDALDEAIKLIRSSKDKQDAAARLMHRFRIDEIQTDAVLELKLYKLAQLEINEIRTELAAKEKRAAEIRTLLADENALWKMVRSELKAIRDKFGDVRRTTVAGPDAKLEYSEEAYIVKEDVFVIVTRDGWIKRQRSYNTLETIRIRDGDTIGWVIPSSTRDTICFFTSLGKAYTIRVDEIFQTTGHGDPIQKYFSFSDKERVVGVASFDKRVLPEAIRETQTSTELFGEVQEESSGPYLVGITAAAMSVRLTLESFVEPSTKLGRTFMKVPPGDEALSVFVARGDENVCLASRNGRGLIFPVSQISIVKGAARGVIAMKLEAKDKLLGFCLSSSARQGLTVETSRGRQEIVRPTKFDVQNRAAKGKSIIERGTLGRVILSPLVMAWNGKIVENEEEG